MRTFWMRLYSAAYWVLVADFVYILVGIILPMMAEQPEVAEFLPLIVVFLGLFLVAALATSLWSGASRRGWVWLAGVVPPILFLLMNAPFVPFALTHPTDVPGFTALLPLVVGTIVLAIAGWRAFRDVRTVAPASPARRTVLAVTATAAAVVGALATSFLTGIGGSVGGSVAEATTTTTLEAKDTKFGTTPLAARRGETLGIVLLNRDSFPHSFDVDSLNITVQMPANSTTIAAITPTIAGTLDFYCAVPGHKEAGMVGTIAVE